MTPPAPTRMSLRECVCDRQRERVRASVRVIEIVRVSGWAVFEMDCERDREIVTKLMLRKIEVEDEEVRKTKCR